ncbi:MAG: biotin--[acetyl-CoA-carboxylase] ligase [Proteobacteria bacterium]|nr:biotin--[acetyl-CoA-carboxylase] ligase [Pseudomonadota bacterium]
MSIWPQGYALREWKEIDSTNEEARRLAGSGERGPVWLRADRQTAGRGRRGRVWESPTGNLAATLLIAPDKPASACAQLSFVTAIAAADTASGFAPNAEIKVKWPNDVLANGRKLAGILLESASGGDGALAFLAIGIGMNLANFPPDTEFPATSLAALGASAPSASAALAQLAAHFAKWYDAWMTGGFLPIQDAWLARAAGLGSHIRARLTHEETSGVFEGIDNTGALILREAHGRMRTIAAGEVFF